MIALDPEFLGGFAPQSQPPTEGTDQGRTAQAVSFVRQPRLHRLHIQGKADETEDASEDEAAAKESSVGVSSSHLSKRDRAGREKRKMRGKDKSLKRFVIFHTTAW